MANSYLTHTPDSAVTLGTKATISFWVKRANTDSTNTFQGILASNGGWNDGTGFAIGWYADELYWYNLKDGNGYRTYPANLRKFRDTSAWYHILYQIDTTQTAVQDRITLYVNGEDQGDFATNTGSGISYAVPAQNTAPYQFFDNGDEHTIGRWGSAGAGATNHLNGYLSHFAYVDGSVVAPTSFGETDSTSGIWKFKSPSGLTWGNNGFHLKFENSGNLGLDSSGQTNNFTTGGNLKQSLDTPSNNLATVNAVSTGNFKQSTNPNLASNAATSLLENGGQHKQAPTTLAVETGKWYCEVKATSGTHGFFGACSTSLSANLGDNYSYPGNSATGSGVSIRRSNGDKTVGGSESTYGGSAISNNDIVGIALDLTNQKIYFSKNGQWSNGSSWSSTTFDAAVGAISLPAGAGTSFDASYQFSFSPYNSGCDINFGNGFFGTTAISSAGSNGNGSLFEYDVPSGFYALNTKNINTYG